MTKICAPVGILSYYARVEGGVKVEIRPVTRPNSFIYTLFGDFVLGGTQGELWIGSLIALMAAFGLSEPAVRQAVSRMSRQGWLAARRHGNRSFYALTERGKRRIESLRPRIYGPVVDWDGKWRVVTYTIAETNRERRDRLRKDLIVLGLAPLSGSTWISPADVLEDVRAAAQSGGLLANVALFCGEYRGPLADRALLERCWDLPLIAQRYRDFIAQYEPRLGALRDAGRVSDEQYFVERMWLVHDYRKFTYVDPGLPSTLLPAHWPGARAAQIFRRHYAEISVAAERFFRGALQR